jgi:hypothetical protein
MRLTVQSFQEDLILRTQIIQNEGLPETLIQQIDTMSAVASAFSNCFDACAKNETLNVVEVVGFDIFLTKIILSSKRIT